MQITASNVGKLALLGVMTLFISMKAVSDESGHKHGHSEHHKEKSPDTKHGHHDNHAHHDSVVGEPASEAEANRTVAIAMMDTMRFDLPENFEVDHGEIITFEVTNKGKVAHEFSIGSSSEQSKHREMMREMPHMKHGDGGSAITVEPGETKKLTWKFMGANEVEFACNIPGHYEAGMKSKGTIRQN